jgi:hypothetical protein
MNVGFGQHVLINFFSALRESLIEQTAIIREQIEKSFGRRAGEQPDILYGFVVPHLEKKLAQNGHAQTTKPPKLVQFR